MDASALDRYPHQFSRRPAPAHLHRPRADDGPRAAGRRRGGVGARRLGAGAGAGAVRGDPQTRLNLAMLFITHDLRVAAQVCDHLAVMSKGRSSSTARRTRSSARRSTSTRARCSTRHPGAISISAKPPPPAPERRRPARHRGHAMRLLLAMMKHETNTFSPVLTDLARFSRAGGKAPDGGAAAIAAYRGTGTVTGAYIDIAEREGAEFDLADRRRRLAQRAGRGRRLSKRSAARSSTRCGAAAATASCSTCTARWSRAATRTAKARCCRASAPSTRRRRSPSATTCTPTSTRRWSSMPTSSPATRPIRMSTCTTPAGAPATR